MINTKEVSYPTKEKALMNSPTQRDNINDTLTEISTTKCRTTTEIHTIKIIRHQNLHASGKVALQRENLGTYNFTEL